MMIFAFALLTALLVDHCLGEPPVRWHPVVWIGNYLGTAGRLLQRNARRAAEGGADWNVFWLGALLWCGGAAMVCFAAGLLQHGLQRLPALLGPLPGALLAALGLGLALKTLLAWAMLRKEALAVEAALDPAEGGSLAAGRDRLSWLVSRDVTQLTEAQVRESAIETLAENLSDSVVAPIFWFLLLGLPGAALYRFANTADAMWGYKGVYKGQNWEWAGKWAARADDVLNWVPARLTGVLLAVLHRVPLRQLRRQARQTPSPNSGWPMAAMALALNVRLGKPGVYTLNPTGQTPQAAQLPLAIGYASNLLIAMMFVVFVLAVLIVFFGGAVG